MFPFRGRDESRPTFRPRSPAGLPRPARLRRLRVLYDREDPRRDETSRAHDTAVARQLPDLDRRARAAHLDAAPGPGRLDRVLARCAAPGVDEDLDEISFCHVFFIPGGGPIHAFYWRDRLASGARAEHGAAAGGGRFLPWLRPVGARDPDGLRRGP